nr:MAG TPA: hypothetical protein [Caudoviricetes sp.]
MVLSSIQYTIYQKSLHFIGKILEIADIFFQSLSLSKFSLNSIYHSHSSIFIK